MKSLFLLFLAILINLAAFSQIIIENQDLMQPGDTFLIHVDLSPVVSTDLTPGANLSWDFTGLQNDQSNYACYAASDDLEFIGEFPLSEFYTYGPGFIYAGPGGGAPLENWGYMMFFTDPDGLFVEGFYSDYGMGYRSTMNTPSELLMFTPANYLDDEINDSHWEVIVDDYALDYDTLYRRDVDKVLNADAWGSIITDYGTYEVLRIHETGISVDSAFGYVGAVTFFSMEMARDTINNYYFWAKDLRNPVLTLHCDYNDNIERIDYLMGAIYSNSDSNITKTNAINVFPNPANNIVHISGIIGDAKLVNCSGQLIKSFYGIENSLSLDVTELTSGLYCLIDSFGNVAKIIVK